MRTILLCILSIAFMVPSSSDAQSKYELRFRIEGLEADNKCQLTMIDGPSSILISETQSETNYVAFSGEKNLKSGFYYLVLPQNKFLQFIIEEDKNFEMSSNLDQMASKVSVEGSEENDEFWGFYQRLAELREEAKELNTEIKDLKKGSKKHDKKREEIKELNGTPAKLSKEIKARNPDGLFAIYLKTQERMKIPKMPDSLEINKNAYTYNYYINHYWDNYRLNDDRSLRMPGFHKKLDEFINVKTIQKADSIIKSADIILSKVGENKKMFQYMTMFITSQYIEPKTMGQDAIFVHMVDNYHSEKDEDRLNIDYATLVRLRAKADKLRPALLGKIAGNIVAPDEDGQLINMYKSVDADYKVLFFFSAGCDHCKAATPGVAKLYSTYKERGVDVFAICTDDESKDFHRFMKKFDLPWNHTVIDTLRRSKFYEKYDVDIMPEFYLLDKDWKFIAKDLNEKQLFGELKKIYEYLDREEQRKLEAAEKIESAKDSDERPEGEDQEEESIENGEG